MIGFERWYARHLIVDSEGHLSADDAVALLGELFDRSRGALHAPLAPVLEDLLAGIDDDPERSADLPEVIQTLEHYLDFVVETGTWLGTDEEIDESAELLEVAFELSTELLGFLLDSLDDVEAVPAGRARRAFEGLPATIRTPAELVQRLRGVLGAVPGDPVDRVSGDVEPAVPAALAVERVMGLLCVAADPGLLPERSEERIRAMLDTAAGVTVEEARAADPDTARMLALLEHDGLLRLTEASGVARYETPADLRPALADAVVEIAEELGLLDDDPLNPHHAGTALQVKVAVIGSRPAQWRRLLLASGSDLGELHLASQLSLDWPNDEPHAFTVAAEPGVVITAVDRIGDDGPAGGVGSADDSDDSTIDENEVQLGELLIDVGDEISYRYGADDPRRLVIRLERVAESDARPLPRCVGASADVAEADRLLAPLRLR
ncbi:IS1096 element passenger TnpR family protein [Herbiconiux ginsengi]|uniref:IS1096 element passenger TnpR family protein n=1 Tax=Herbiconiux ginsengi TaxID=381665 RepID=UPI000B838DA7|nr:hypothetical protein [Herbiconiux ginsengi]